MFIDASAIVAALTFEVGWQAVEKALLAAGESRYCSALVEFEAVAAITRKYTTNGLTHFENVIAATKNVHAFFVEYEVKMVPMTAEHGQIAVYASGKFGRGSGHPAKLNMGDCFAYAMAKTLDVPLLFIGNDFIHTDIKSALDDPLP